MSDPERYLLEALAASVARIESAVERLEREAARKARETERRRQYPRDAKDGHSDGPCDGHSDGLNPLPFSPPPFPTPQSPSPLSPPLEKQKRIAQSDEKAIALAPAAEALAGFIRQEWADVRRPREFASRAQAAFPGVDLAAEARKARGWEVANPRLAKKNHGRYLWAWLNKAQDSLGKPGAVLSLESAQIAKAEELAIKRRAETQTLLEKQEREVPRVSLEEAKKKLEMLKNTVLIGMSK